VRKTSEGLSKQRVCAFVRYFYQYNA
jgi:hypothetical protein